MSEVKAPNIAGICVHLKIRECSTCGSHPVSYCRPWQHSFGEYYEELKFDCGHVIAWSPNYSAMQILTPCPETQEAREKYIERIAELQDEVEQARKELHEFDQQIKRGKEMRRGKRTTPKRR